MNPSSYAGHKEMPSKTQKIAESAEIEAQTKEFLAAGGEIQYIESGNCVYKEDDFE